MLEINPLDVLNQRIVKTNPPHFSSFKIDENNYYIDDIKNWVLDNLKGRFSIFRLPSIGNDGKLKNSVFVSFEEETELTFFMLACPFLRRNI